MEGFHFSTGALVFVAYAVVDALYARYTLSVTAVREWNAATIGAFIHFLLAFGVLQYTENPWYIVPLAAGSWVGTFWAVRRERTRREKRENK